MKYFCLLTAVGGNSSRPLPSVVNDFALSKVTMLNNTKVSLVFIMLVFYFSLTSELKAKKLRVNHGYYDVSCSKEWGADCAL